MESKVIMITKVFKVIKQQPSGKLTSALVYATDGSLLYEGRTYGVVYEEKKWNVPHPELKEKGYGICVFASLDDALEFKKGLYYSTSYLLFTCLANGVYKSLPKMLDVLSLKFGNGFFVTNSIWPKGTMMTNHLKLIRRVEDDSSMC